MKRLLLLLAALLFSANLSYSAVPDSCIKLVFAHNFDLEYHNPDSVCCDSCYDSPTYMQFYANRHYTLKFVDDYYPFDEPLYRNDLRTVDEMSDSKPELKSKFQEFETRYGKIFFKGMENDTVAASEDVLHYALIRVAFEKYQLIEEIKTVFENEIDSLENRYVGTPFWCIYIGVHENPSESGSVVIYPNPADAYIDIINKEGTAIEKIEIFSLYGEKLCEFAGGQRIDISNLSQGTYYIRVNNSFHKFSIVR